MCLGEVQQVMEVHSSEEQTIHGGDTVVQVHTVGGTGTDNIIHASSEAVQNLLQQVSSMMLLLFYIVW